MGYFPNSSYGLRFDEECMDCKYGEKTCPIAGVQLFYNYDQVGNDLARKILSDLVSDNGVCEMKKIL